MISDKTETLSNQHLIMSPVFVVFSAISATSQNTCSRLYTNQASVYPQAIGNKLFTNHQAAMNSVRMAHINTQKFLSSPAANNLQNVFSAQQEIIDDYTQVQTDPIKHPRGNFAL